MSTWARIYAEIAASEDVANLRNQNPDAALLFVLGMPQAMPWGILPASPALFRAKVCPLFDLTLGQIEACLRLVIDSGLFTEYTDSRGKALVYYTAWNRYQGAQQWSRVGPPPFDLPPHWEPPENLPKALQQAARSNRGLTLEAIEARVLDSESKTSLRQAVNEPITSHRQGGEEVRSKKEEVRNGNDSASPSANAGSEQPKSTRKPRAPKPPAEDTPAQAAIRRCYQAVFGDEAIPGGQGYAGLVKLYQEHGEDVFRKLAERIRGRQQPEGTKQWPWFCKLMRDELNAKFKWLPDTSPDPRKGAFIRLRDGVTLEYEANWTFGQAYEVKVQRTIGNWNEATGCTKTPVNGFCCDDGYYYPTGQEPVRWAR